jgi:hypothetical protein
MKKEFSGKKRRSRSKGEDNVILRKGKSIKDKQYLE